MIRPSRAIDIQRQNIDIVKEAKGFERDARKALQRELYLTLVYLMVTYPLQPEKLEQYMKQHLLEDHPAAPDDGEVEPEPAPPVEE